MITLALADQPVWLAISIACLVFTEWLDGFLARRFHLESAVGARLDTFADVVFYACLLVAVIALRPGLILEQELWILVAVGSYIVSWLFSIIKFGRFPSYHTWAAKGSWVMVGVGTICSLAELGNWPFQLAMISVLLTNLEASCITLALRESQVDVPTLWHAYRRG